MGPAGPPEISQGRHTAALTSPPRPSTDFGGLRSTERLNAGVFPRWNAAADGLECEGWSPRQPRHGDANRASALAAIGTRSRSIASGEADRTLGAYRLTSYKRSSGKRSIFTPPLVRVMMNVAAWGSTHDVAWHWWVFFLEIIPCYASVAFSRSARNLANIEKYGSRADYRVALETEPSALIVGTLFAAAVIAAIITAVIGFLFDLVNALPQLVKGCFGAAQHSVPIDR